MTEKSRKNTRFSEKLNAFWQKILSFFKKDEKGKQNLKVHSKFSALIQVQYRDKVDTGWTKSIKTIIQKTVFFILKFVIIFVVVVVALRLVAFLFMIQTGILNFFLIFLGFYTILNLFSVTFGLVKTLYHADDNRVLATYPTTSLKLFLSKILVFELFELKRSFDILLPISLGFLFVGVYFKTIPAIVMLWSLIPLFLIVTVTVLLGALLSIPALFVYNFFKKHFILETITIAIVAAGIVVLIVHLINLIPENKGDINMQNSFLKIKDAIDSFSMIFAKIVYPVSYAYRAIVGEATMTLTNKITLVTLGRVGIMILASGILFALVLLLIKPFYFKMMTKSFEFNKEIVDDAKENKAREKHWTFVLKEIKLTLRDLGLSGSYIGVYIATPVLLLLIDKVFAAMATNGQGDLMVAAFNILLTILPLLTSSTLVGTLYSREGRTAYIKKTKPMKPYFMLTSKMFFNLILVIPSVVACSFIFAKYTNQNVGCAILLAFTVLAFQYGHIFYSATLDIMNPQNEVYATEGDGVSNPNERKSTAIAFILSILVTLVSFLLLRENLLKYKNFNRAFIKLLLISLVWAGSCILLFFLKVKAYYIDRQEASRE